MDDEGPVIGYNVEVVVTGLKERELYQFEVAAESSIGVGEFSEPSDNAKLGELILRKVESRKCGQKGIKVTSFTHEMQFWEGGAVIF